MAANVNITPLVVGSYTRGTSFPQSSNPTPGNCSNASCHFETATPTWGSAASSTNCNTCHATPRATTGSHGKHEAAYGGTASCTQCHPNYGTTSFNHATSAGKHKIVTNNFLTYSGGSATSWLPSQGKAYGSCRAAACHDTGRDNPRTPVWGTSKAACTACHNSPRNN